MIIAPEKTPYFFYSSCIAMIYKLPCSCGSFVPVEPNQAGRQVTCVCGKSLQVPTMSQMANLEPLTSNEQAAADRGDMPSRKDKPSGRSVYLQFIIGVVSPFIASMVLWVSGILSYSFLGAFLFFVSGGFFLVLAIVRLSLILKARNYLIRTKHVVVGIGVLTFLITGLLFAVGAMRYPQLHDVCLMNHYYVHGGKVIGRDTQPISPRDFRLLVDERIVAKRYAIMSEDLINQHPIYVERPILLVEMHDYLRGGLEFSHNFYEKYDKLIFYYWARFIVLGVLMLVSLIVIAVGVFLPDQTEEIGERGGESWE